MSADPADREVGPGRTEGPAGSHGGLAAAFVANTVDDGPPGLEPTLGSLRRAIDEIETALAATGSVRSALTDLAAGKPGDDRVLLSFLRTRLGSPDARLLEILAGISEEHRALLRAQAEILAIYERPYREPLLALDRLAASTAEYRTLAVATYLAPRAQPQSRHPLGASGPLAGGKREAGAAGTATSGPGSVTGRRGSGNTDERERGSAFGWLSGLLRPAASPRRGDGGSGALEASAPHRAPDEAGVAAVAVELDDLPLEAHRGASGAADSAMAPAFLDGESPAVASAPSVAASEIAPPAFLDPASDEEIDVVAEPETTRSSAIAVPTATATSSARSSRPRASRPKARSAGSGGGRRIAGFGLAIIIPAIAAMWVGGLRQPTTASAGDGSAVAAATSPAVSLAPASGAPLTIKEDPDVIPLGDDHGSGGLPIGTAAPGMASLLPIVADTNTAAGVTLAFTGPTDRKVIALTFDDGYAPPNTRAIFDILVREEVKATFFVNGYYLSRDPALWKEIADAGFPVGNHTYYHVDVRTLDAAAIKQELRMTSSAWKRVTGGRMISYFRPPYGGRTVATDAAVAAAGYKHIVMWDTSSADTKAGITDQAATASALSGGAGSIVLLHAGPDVTPRILQAVIDGYRARGFDFVTIPELLGP